MCLPVSAILWFCYYFFTVCFPHEPSSLHSTLCHQVTPSASSTWGCRNLSSHHIPRWTHCPALDSLQHLLLHLTPGTQNWAQHSQVLTRREETLSLLTTHFLVHPSWSWPSLKRHIQTLLTIPPSMSIQFFPATAFYPVSLCNCLVQDKYPISFYFISIYMCVCVCIKFD